MRSSCALLVVWMMIMGARGALVVNIPGTVHVVEQAEVLAAIVSVEVELDEAHETATMTLGLHTDVEAPFELYSIRDASDTLTLADDGQDGLLAGVSVVGGSAERTTDECTDGSAACSAAWQIEYSASAESGDETCEFDGKYRLRFSVRCTDPEDSACSMDGVENTTDVDVVVDTQHHCGVVVVQASTSVGVYDSAARFGAEAEMFYAGGPGEVAFVAAPTTLDDSQLTIVSTEVVAVRLVRADASQPDVVLLDKGNTYGQGIITCDPVAQRAGGAAPARETVSAQTGCGTFALKHGRGGAAPPTGTSTPVLEFAFVGSAPLLNLGDDEVEEVEVRVIVAASYESAENEIGTALAEASSTVELSGSKAPTSESTESDSNVLGMSTTTAYAVGAGIVLVLVLVVVTAAARRSSRQAAAQAGEDSDIELQQERGSGQLQQSSSAADVSTL